jgi:hypothetical protein
MKKNIPAEKLVQAVLKNPNVLNNPDFLIKGIKQAEAHGEKERKSDNMAFNIAMVLGVLFIAMCIYCYLRFNLQII